jgi:hypothetical protein
MNIEAAVYLRMVAVGTTEGAVKGWDTKGRGRKMFMPPTRKWKGLDVDKDLKNEVLERLNHNPQGNVVSTCAGHSEYADKTVGGSGGTDHSFSLRLDNPDMENAEKLAAAVRSPDTDVTTNVWRGNLVSHVDGKLREDIFQKYPELKERLKEPIDHIGFNVNSKLKNTGSNQAELDAWWNNTIQRLDDAKI